MHRSIQIQRILKEKQEFEANLSENIFAAPLEGHLHIWHFTIRGPPDTEFQDGIYHGRIDLPVDYPLKAPAIYFLTPNGRYEVNTQICLTITSYHPETWNPAWTIRSMLQALISLFPEKEKNPGIGALNLSREERKKLALLSKEYTCRHCGPVIKLLRNLLREEERPDIQNTPPNDIIIARKKEVEIPNHQQSLQESQQVQSESNDKMETKKSYTQHVSSVPVVLAEAEQNKITKTINLHHSQHEKDQEVSTMAGSKVSNTPYAHDKLEEEKVSSISARSIRSKAEQEGSKKTQQMDYSKSVQRVPLRWHQDRQDVPPILEYILRQHEFYCEAKKSVAYCPNILNFSQRAGRSTIYSLANVLSQPEDALEGRLATGRARASGSPSRESNPVNTTFSQSYPLSQQMPTEESPDEIVTTQKQMLVDLAMLSGAALLLGYTAFTRLFYD